jgi:hypothetical protein
MNNRYVSYGTLSQVSLVSLPLRMFARIPFLLGLNVGDWIVEGSEAINDPNP